MEKKFDYLPYVLIAPGIAILIFVYVWPLTSSIVWSLQYKYLLRIERTRWVGLQNYIHFIKSPVFWTRVWTTVMYAGGTVIINFVIGIITALALNRNIPGRDIFRAMIIIPWMLPTTIVAITAEWLLSGLTGPINDLLTRFGFIKEPISFFGSVKWALPTMIFLTSWRSSPFVIVMILAAFQAIPRDLYEAARVDGAGIWHSFIHITLPLARPTIVVCLLLSYVWNFNFMDFVYVITRGGPISTTEIIPLYIYFRLFQRYRFGETCALSILSLLMLSIFMYFYIKVVWKGGGAQYST